MPWTSSSLALAVSALLLLAPAASAQEPLPAGQIARVGDQPILKTEYDHWYEIARGSGADDEDLRAQVMQLLISFRWLEGEAVLQGITVTTRRVNAEYRRQKRVSFPKERDFRRFLRTSGQTIADVKSRVRIDLLATRIKERAIGDAKTARGQLRRLERFVADFATRWKAQTVCVKGYETEEDCGTVVPPST